MEWLIDASPPNTDGGQERVAFGGVDDPSLHVTEVHLSDAEQILFGWSGQLLESESVDVWFDDIAIAHTPMGCP